MSSQVHCNCIGVGSDDTHRVRLSFGEMFVLAIVGEEVKWWAKSGAGSHQTELSLSWKHKATTQPRTFGRGHRLSNGSVFASVLTIDFHCGDHTDNEIGCTKSKASTRYWKARMYGTRRLLNFGYSWCNLHALAYRQPHTHPSP